MNPSPICAKQNLRADHNPVILKSNRSENLERSKDGLDLEEDALTRFLLCETLLNSAHNGKNAWTLIS